MAIINIGNHDFEPTGPVAWYPNGWELDRLIVPMRGSVANEAAYIASLVLWAVSDIDSNMFLASWDSDHHPQFPTVRLTYIGKKGGTLPPVKHRPGTAITSGQISKDVSLLGGAVWFTARVPVFVFTWITRIAKDSPQPVPSILDGYQVLSGGPYTFTGGTNIVTGLSGVSAGDGVILIGGFNRALLLSTGGNTVDTVNPFATIVFSLAIRIIISNIDVQTLSINSVQPFTGLPITTDPRYGLLLIFAYFHPLFESSIESDELVPESTPGANNGYYRNTQRIQLALIQRFAGS
jgi:hypothetical protein